MVLEATIIIVDNSEHSRNGDYLPSRFEAQTDAVHLLFTAKTQSNPESSVGLMTLGGPQPEVLCTLTNDFGKILEGLHRTRIRGTAHLSTTLNVAGLALKHRQNKSQHQRIIVFSCSPLVESEKEMIRLGKRMKKNTINVDVIRFGDTSTTGAGGPSPSAGLNGDAPDGEEKSDAKSDVEKLELFHENIKGSADGSNLAIIPPGPNLLSDSIVATPILAGDGIGGSGAGGVGGDTAMGGTDGGAGGGGGGGDSGFEFGFDPNSDPELALAMRMSLEEEERRKQREEKEKQDNEGGNLETVPEGNEKPDESGEGSSGGGGDGSSGEKKEGGADGKMDTS